MQMTMRPLFFMLYAALLAGTAAAQAQTTSPPARGQLLYENHCSTCHDQQIHWRQNKLARDWNSLHAQVQRWQANAKLGWSTQEIDQVARYLNDTIYRFPHTGLAQRD